MGPEARKASVNDLLTLAAHWNRDDPRGTMQRWVAISLFEPYPGSNTPTILNKSLEGVDRRLLYPAMRALLRNDDSVVRGCVGSYLKQLTDADLAVLLPEIIKAIEEMAPSDEMWADDIRLAGLDLLSRRHIREGMVLCVSTIERRWGNDLQKRLEYLKRYGVQAKEVLPRLRKKRSDWPAGAKAIDRCIADIEASKDSPTVVEMKDFIAHASTNPDASINTKNGTP